MITVRTVETGPSIPFVPRVFGKVLHLARLYGWHPEKVSSEWPVASWTTHLILPHIGPYMPGPVSESDALALAAALGKAVAAESAVLENDVYLGLMMVLNVAKHGAFEVELETHGESLPALCARG